MGARYSLTHMGGLNLNDGVFRDNLGGVINLFVASEKILDDSGRVMDELLVGAI